MENEKLYHISLFKPTTERARANRNMVLWLVSIWFVAVFGFQIVLRIIEKPVPEENLVRFRTAWTNYQAGNISPEDYSAIAHAGLNVIGKNNLTTGEMESMKTAVSWSLYNVIPSEMREELVGDIGEFEVISAGTDNISDEKYLQQKNKLTEKYSDFLGIDAGDIRKSLFPLALRSENISNPGEKQELLIAGVMKKFMVHNQSVLTDFKFLGFPFHYFYTAVFLLILFVGLCWVYCVKTDAMNKKLQISE